MKLSDETEVRISLGDLVIEQDEMRVRLEMHDVVALIKWLDSLPKKEVWADVDA